MRAVETTPSSRATPTTTCSDRSAREPERHGDDGGDGPQRQHDAAPPRRGVVDELRRCRAAGRVTSAVTSRWRSAIGMPSPTPIAASGGEPKWSSSLRMLPGRVAQLVGDRRQPQHDADADGPARWPIAIGGGRAARPAATGRRWRPRRARPSRRRAAGRARGSGRSTSPRRRAARARRWSPHSTPHVASSTTTQATRGRYGFHGWVSGTWP